MYSLTFRVRAMLP